MNGRNIVQLPYCVFPIRLPRSVHLGYLWIYQQYFFFSWTWQSPACSYRNYWENWRSHWTCRLWRERPWILWHEQQISWVSNLTRFPSNSSEISTRMMIWMLMSVKVPLEIFNVKKWRLNFFSWNQTFFLHWNTFVLEYTV